MLNFEKLKLFLEEINGEKDTHFRDLNFNELQFNGPVTRTHAKLIDYKNAVQLALSILKEEEEAENETDIFAMCEIPFDQCHICDAEKDHQNIIIPKN